MNKTWFTSDLHLGDDRIGTKDISTNLFFRPFETVDEQNKTIINNINKLVDKDDYLYILGDVCYSKESVYLLEQINCKNLYLTVGNYDEDKIDLLAPYFISINNDYSNKFVNNSEFSDELLEIIMCHYPTRALLYLGNNFENKLALTGHIHGLWKVQRNMINVSTDAWHFRPVSLEQILFCRNAMLNYYDKNVFPYN